MPLERPRRERADAVRNRLHLLRVARRLIAEEGADRLTMDGLAAAADLGKGTVFRRFGTRAGIFRALLEDSEQEFQRAVLEGPPPLGPGAPPVERLAAFGRARVEHLAANIEVVGQSRVDGHGEGPLGSFSVLHFRVLLEGVDLPGISLDAVAVLLAAAVETPLLLTLDRHDVESLPGSVEDLAAAWEALVRRMVG
ncbi:TetR/AcrR family transcriptional regulator [Nocardiopsis sp. MG754419]|nr:TetR/AcrR family transcriptional regulator [Nocardiopsis sp. MG754419]